MHARPPTPALILALAVLTAGCGSSADDGAASDEDTGFVAPTGDTGAVHPTSDAGGDASRETSTTDAADASPGDASSTDTRPASDAAPPTDDLGAAQAFVAPLVLGVNVERGWAWDVPGGASYWSYLATTAHLTHVRLFYPWRPSIAMGGGGSGNSPPDEAAFGRILDAAQRAIDAGLVVFLDCTDVMGVEDFTGSNGAETETHIANCAKWVAARHFDAKKLALGPVNEWAGGDDNTTYNDYRKHFHGVLRAALPGYVLTTGPGYWKSRDWIYDDGKKFETFDDLRVVYEWHEYSSLDAAGWASEEAKLDAWRKSHGGRPTICGEAGAGYWDEPVDGTTLAKAPAAWPDRFAAMLPAIAKDAPSIWAVTYGGDYRINKSGGDPHVMDGTGGQPNLLQSLLDAEAAMKKAKP